MGYLAAGAMWAVGTGRGDRAQGWGQLWDGLRNSENWNQGRGGTATWDVTGLGDSRGRGQNGSAVKGRYGLLQRMSQCKEAPWSPWRGHPAQ